MADAARAECDFIHNETPCPNCGRVALRIDHCFRTVAVTRADWDKHTAPSRPPADTCPEGCVCEEKCLPAALEEIEKTMTSGAADVIDLLGALSDALKEKSA